jgi:hypothetical protein
MYDFDFSAFLTNIVNALVLLSLPAPLMRLIALYLMVLTSRICYRAHLQTLDLKEQVAGSIARLVGGTQIYRGLTHQSQKLERGLEMRDFETRMRESLARSIESGALSDKEIAFIVGLVERRFLQNSEDGKSSDIGLPEFLDTFTSNETIPLADLEEFVDLDRKRCIFEKLLTDTKFSISQEDAIPLPSTRRDANEDAQSKPVQAQPDNQCVYGAAPVVLAARVEELRSGTEWLNTAKKQSPRARERSVGETRNL